jgi:hypothetical protein
VRAIDQLTDLQFAVLSFEANWQSHSAAKEEAIREVFGFPAARYYQVLNSVIDLPAAVRHDPMLVGRLQRSRDARANARASRAFASSTADRAARARSSESNEFHGEVPERPV